MQGSYRVSRTGDTTDPLSVKLSISGSATYAALAYDDYTLTNVGGATGYYVTIPAGSSSEDITLTAIEDSFNEPTEAATLTVVAYSVSPTPYTIGAASSASVNIVYGDPVVTITAIGNPAGAPVINEALEESATFRISRTGSTTDPLQVKIDVGGTAYYGVVADDFTLTNVSGSTGSYVTIPAGASSVDVTVTAQSDSTPEDDETVILSILDYGVTTTPYGIGAASSATVTITDAHPCGDGNQYSDGKCLVVTDLQVKLTVSIKFSLNTVPDEVASSLSEGAADILTGVVKMLMEHLRDELFDSVLEGASSFLTVASKLTLPTANLEHLIIDQIGLRFDAVAAGTLFSWNGSAWDSGTPFATSEFLLFQPQSKFLNHLNMGGEANRTQFLLKLQELFAETEQGLTNVTALQTTIEGAVGGESATSNIMYKLQVSPTP